MNNPFIKIAIAIVLYNPKDINRLRECITSAEKISNNIYIFDNSDNSINYDFSLDIKYFTNNKNCGLAFALNYLVECAKNDGFEWIITLDQDSIIPDDIIDEYKKIILNTENLGIVCPQVIDSRRKYLKIKKEPKVENVDFCITSGSCISIKAWGKVGKFDEWLFIDLIDNDFCKRLVLSGYKIIRLNNFILNQQYGEIIEKSEPIRDFWIKLSKILRNVNIAKLSYKKNVNPIRVYYTCRNIIYVNKKFASYGKVGYENYNCKSYFGFIFCFIIPSVIRSNKKIETIKSVFNGTIDGINKNVEKFSL